MPLLLAEFRLPLLKLSKSSVQCCTGEELALLLLGLSPYRHPAAQILAPFEEVAMDV